MTDRNDGPWDAPTDHERARDGDAKAITSTTLPPPSFQRKPAKPAAPAPTVAEATPAPMAASDVVIVATGADEDRVRRLCQQHALRVPVTASPDTVHDAMTMVVIGEPSPPTPARVVHVVRPAVPDEQLIDLLRALVTRRTVVDPPAAPVGADPKLGDIARRLSTLSDRGTIETIMLGAITALTDADRAHCLFHDPTSGALWSEARLRAGADDRRATGGLVGWAAHTGQTLHASPAGDDPRWLQELDDPDEGKPQSRLLVQPIISADCRVHAVLVAARRWRRPDFSDREVKALATFAALVGPALDAAAAASPRKPRTTQPGPLASASRPAIVATPRAPADSRPPLTSPGISRAGSSPALGPDPFSDERTRLDMPPGTREPEDYTRVDDAPRARSDDDAHDDDEHDDYTRVDDGPAERYSADSILPLPLPPVTPSSPALPDVPAASASDAAPPARSGSPTLPPVDAVTVVARKRPTTSPATAPEPSPPTPLATRPVTSPPASMPTRIPTSPLDEAEPIAPVTRATPRPSTPLPLRAAPVRARTATDSRQPPLASEPRDLAVIAGTDDTRRVQKIAKKARLELATFSQLADAPDICQVVTIGGAWTDDRRVVYAARSTITDEHLADLLTALTTGRSLEPPPLLARPQAMGEARRLQRALDGARALAASTDLAAAEDSITTTIRELLDCDRAYCWFVDPDTGALWSEVRRRAGIDDRRAVAGIAGFVARTGRAARAAHASTDPRWLGPLDDPDGDPHSQLLVQPLIRADQRVHGVLIAARRARRPGFTDPDATLLARFAAMTAPLLEQLEIYVEAKQLAGPAPSAQLPAVIPAAAEPPSSWLAVLRGQHPLSRWLYLGLGALVGTLVALLA